MFYFGNLIVAIILHYREFIKLNLEHKVLYLLLKNLVLDWNRINIIKQFEDQVRTRFISQLISDILRVFQKLLISTFIVLSLPVWPVIFSLNLNKALLLLLTGISITAPLGSKILQYYRTILLPWTSWCFGIIITIFC